MANESTTDPNSVTPGKLWFGFTGSAAAWVALSCGYSLLAWWACQPEGILSGGRVRSGIGFAYFFAALIIIGAAVFAGVVSYRNWRQLSTAPSLNDTLGDSRPEFMALMGLFVSVTLGAGLIWLTIPLLILNFCVRAR